MNQAFQAAEILASDPNIQVAVANPRFIKPLNEPLILQLEKQTGRILTI